MEMKLNQENIRKLMSGQGGGAFAGVVRFGLAGAAKIYSLVAGARNCLYDKGLLKARRVDAAVISIGNLTAGGTGKTPLVIWVCNFLQDKGVASAILTRGYKATEKDTDEPAMLAKNCPSTKVIVEPDRVKGAEKALSKSDAKALVMDDGFQHRRLARDIDIVTVDATEPFGYEKMLPAGLLREPINSLKRAQAVVITRSDQVAEDELSRLEERLRGINEDMIIARAVHSPVCVKSMGGRKIGLEELMGKKVFAFCGIGNPDSFFNTVEVACGQLVGTKVFNDHHKYTKADISNVCEQAKMLEADYILSTEKDWTKTCLLASCAGDVTFGCLAIELKFTSGENKLKQLIEEALADRIL